MSKLGKGYQVGLSWIPFNADSTPPKAIDVDNGVFVARVSHEGEVVPGMFVKSMGIAYYPYGASEHRSYTCEILCDSSLLDGVTCYRWESSSGGTVPKKAIVGGLSVDNDPLYIARCCINDKWLSGKVHQGHSCAYFPYDGEEKAVDEYDVLVWVK